MCPSMKNQQGKGERNTDPESALEQGGSNADFMRLSV